MSLILETPRLILRPFCPADLEAFLAYRNDPQVFRFQGWQVPFTRVDAEDFIEQMQSRIPGTHGEWLQLALEPRSMKDKMIGDVAFHILRGNSRLAYLGYSLSRPAWGQGYAYEAVGALLDHLFKSLDLHRVVANCDVDNVSSIRLLERLGFRREAHNIESYWLEREKVWGSEYLYALLQREWVLR